jgi:von Willebrand factor type A domain
MTKPNSTLLVMVLDRSGSMSDIAKDVIGGCDTFIKAQAKAPGECRITLCQFDTEYQEVWTLRDIQNVPSIGTFYSPRGSTALNDAVARTIMSVGSELANRSEDERPATVIFMIVTDGQENASVEFGGPNGKARIKSMIAHQTEKYGWKFTYLGANVDAFTEAQSYGIAPSAAVNFAATKKGMMGTYEAMSASVLRSRVSGEDVSYTNAERSLAMGLDSDIGELLEDSNELLVTPEPPK